MRMHFFVKVTMLSLFNYKQNIAKKNQRVLTKNICETANGKCIKRKSKCSINQKVDKQMSSPGNVTKSCIPKGKNK